MGTMGDLDKLIAAVEAGEWATGLHLPYELHTDLTWKAFNGSLDAALRLHEALLPEWRMGLRSHDAIEGNGFAAWVTSPDYRTVCWTAGDQDTITTLSGLRATGDADKPARAFLLAILRALQAQSAPPISPEQSQFDAVRHHERFGPLDEKGNPVDPRRRG